MDDMERETDPSLLQPGPDGCTVRADANLIAAGWERRHFADAERARESVALYSSMGFEVMTRKLEPSDFSPVCQACALSECRSYVMIYTRKSKRQSN
ncbi:MAG: hypothetical protein ACYTHJ_15270 [Planctomycetota bacterium]|jgi:hypothetical protein